MNISRFATRSWIGGLILALLGVLIARMVAPSLTDIKTRSLVAAAGQIVAVLGLGWIALGIHKRIKQDSTDQHTP